MSNYELTEFNNCCFFLCFFCEKAKRNNISKSKKSLEKLYHHVRSCPNHDVRKTNDRIRGFSQDLTKRDFLKIIRNAIQGDENAIYKLVDLGMVKK